VSCGQSGGDVVFVSESAEDLLPADPVLGEVYWFGRPGACGVPEVCLACELQR